EWVFDPRLGIMYLNLFDAFLVGLNVFELFLFPLFLATSFGSVERPRAGEVKEEWRKEWVDALNQFHAESGDKDQQSNSLRVVKLMRIVRTLRIVKTLTMFRQLRLLVGTCVASIGALFWSMVLLLVLKLGFALIICQALQGFIMDPAAAGLRLEMNNLYGSFLKALYTMFEVTHSGSWPAVVRPVIEKVSPWYAAFFLTYLTLVVFAVIRVVTALFIKETLASAANDADMVMEDARRAAAETNLKLEELFLEADTDGDGNLTLEEFVATMSLPSVKRFLQSLDVSIRDVGPLFDILDDGDGAINATEFCDGLLRLKGQARAIDMVVL
ncbi:Voltage-dependent T-type calcium channel subunit alpha-1G, partial [Durusdinium trenchii]